MMSSKREELYKFFGSLTEDKYNQFFNPNVCHVCKQPHEDLTECNNCHMISYCCDNHKLLHQDSHKEVCTTIAKVLSIESDWDIINYSLEDWIESQKEFMRIIRCGLRRDLELYEVEMFMSAKSCHICHQQRDLSTCNNCYSVNFCDNHQDQFKKKHTSYCKDLLLLLNINIASMENNICNSYPDNLNFTTFPDEKPYHNMITFVDGYIASRNTSSQLRRKMTLSWKMEYYVYSDYVSSPLTFYYALKEIGLLHLLQNVREIIIHIIDASAVDVMGLPAWELLLHLFHNIKELHIVMIKSKTIFESGEYDNLCERCICFRQKLYIENVSEPYYDYVNLESYKEPNVIIGFEAEFTPEQTWSKTLATILSRSCPLLLTAKSKIKAQEIINKIRKILGTGKGNVCEKNEYPSCKPYKDYETDGVFFRNAHFIML